MQFCVFQAEDRVDQLTRDLLKIQHRLQATEDEKRGKEEEAAMVMGFIYLFFKKVSKIIAGCCKKEK